MLDMRHSALILRQNQIFSCPSVNRRKFAKMHTILSVSRHSCNPARQTVRLSEDTVLSSNVTTLTNHCLS